jgi:hypothetical protein
LTARRKEAEAGYGVEELGRADAARGGGGRASGGGDGDGGGGDVDAALSEEMPDLSMMGSALLGGANVTSLSAAERQAYVNGITIRARCVTALH